MERVVTGLERLNTEGFKSLKGARVGLLANQAAADSSFRHARDLIYASDTCTLSKLLAPEHGFFGVQQDMDPVENCADPRTKLPIISLYGKGSQSLRPEPAVLEDLDVLVVDLPDIGSRYYTFAQSLAYTMQTAAQTGTGILVLDRPNPLGGSMAEGSTLLASCRSFCGYAPVPQRHSLTLGELAILMNKGFGVGEDSIPAINCELEVVKMLGWKREMSFEQTGLPWIIPSTNMPTLDTAFVYPGTCLFEATTLSEGRGTTRPFEMLGAPYIDGYEWAKAVSQLTVDLKGAVLRPVRFMPKIQKHANQVCGGVQIHVTDRHSFQPFRWGLALLHTAARLYPKKFSLRSHSYEFVDSPPALDLLYGSPRLREHLGQDGQLQDLFAELGAFESCYVQARQEFLIY